MTIGDKIPDLLGIDTNNNQIKLSNFKGKKIILYFYPKDNTSGCTAEACCFRDNYQEITSLGYEVIGVSIDSKNSHIKFSSKYDLPFTLISDEEKSLVQQMEVWGEKSLYGKKYMGTLRTTFIINEYGVIEKIFSSKEIKTKSHAEQILQYIR